MMTDEPIIPKWVHVDDVNIFSDSGKKSSLLGYEDYNFWLEFCIDEMYNPVSI